jgi:hypothetical protein
LSKLIEGSAVDALQSERFFRVLVMAFSLDVSQQLVLHVFFEQDSHAAEASFSCANSRNAPSTALSLNVG